MRIRIALVFGLVWFVGSRLAHAQRGEAPVPLPAGGAEAQQLLRDGKPRESAIAFEALVKKHPQVGPLWLWLGRAAAANNDYPRAVQAFERGVAIDSNPRSIYNAGAAHARLGHVDKAFDYLKRAAQTGLVPVGAFRTDSDLDALRSDPRFPDILKLAVEKAKAP